MDVTVTSLLGQMAYVIPTILAAAMTFTSAIHGIFKTTEGWVDHLISWIIAIAVAEGFVALNGLTFGLGGWDYAIAGVCGIIVGASSNGIYDWEKIKAFFDAFASIFGKKES